MAKSTAPARREPQADAVSLSAGQVETTTGVYDLSDPEQKRRMVADGTPPDVICEKNGSG